MNCNERIDLGPNRWAEQQIKKALNVLVFLSPGLLQVAASDLKGMEFSQQVQCKDQSDVSLYSITLNPFKVTSHLRACY